MIILYGIGLDVLALAVVLVFGAFYFRASRHDGYEDGYNEGRADRAQQEAAERAAQRTRGRHARAQPRTAPAKPPGTGTWHLPIPGPPKPQTGRDSGPGTVTLDKLTTTGEIGVYKARTDKFIADHCS